MARPKKQKADAVERLPNAKQVAMARPKKQKADAVERLPNAKQVASILKDGQQASEQIAEIRGGHGARLKAFFDNGHGDKDATAILKKLNKIGQSKGAERRDAILRHVNAISDALISDGYWDAGTGEMDFGSEEKSEKDKEFDDAAPTDDEQKLTPEQTAAAEEAEKVKSNVTALRRGIKPTEGTAAGSYSVG